MTEAIFENLVPLGLAGLLLAAVPAFIISAFMERAKKRDHRRARIAKHAPSATQNAHLNVSAEDEARRTANAIKARLRASGHFSLINYAKRAGLEWSERRVMLVLAGICAAITGVLFVIGVSWPIAVVLGLLGGPAISFLALRIVYKRRRRAMESEFPGALDVIVRGVKSGLPLNDCLQIVAREAREPLAGEFAVMVEQQSHGVPIAEVVERFAKRVPLAEANFFAILIAIQTRTGGRLAESLENLVNVLRARTQLSAKIKSMSSEAKASAGIIGALPPLVGGLVYLTTPEYIGLLFTEPLGNAVLAGSAVWMGVGIMVMSKMINFNY